ncbi:MAG: DUF1364 domain-containing protein [Planctomycetaceae bacterium]|nr:DUF1364 domain-containing protein [Planctomycetaceae bacterium]
MAKRKESKYTKSARGENCTARIAGVCNYDPATTVFAHLNGGGMGRKHSDIHGAYLCSGCHAWMDGGYISTDPRRKVRDFEHLSAMLETQIKMIDKGVLVL